MPSISKLPATKRAGAPKAKGAVRAKSGCYTCRIRRKKCDEQPNEAGQCQTCVRLRVECLGFGAKRPEWLRESRNVVDLRDRIKTFLAAQGMIKGHSGSGPRAADHSPPVLRLADSETGSTSSESPPTPTLTLSTEGARHHISSMRDDPWTTLSPVEPYNNSGLYPSSGTTLRSVSPYDGSSHGSVHEIIPYHQLSTLNSSNLASPAVASSFGSLYHHIFHPEEYEYPFIDSNGIVSGACGNGSTMYNFPEPYVPVDELVGHYMKYVINIQYLLADNEITGIIYDTVSRPGYSRDAVKLLASVHAKRFRQPLHSGLENIDTPLRELLNQNHLVTEDAMAALHVVSVFLFDGGQGFWWKDWLQVACTYVDCLFAQYRGGAPDALLNCNAKEAFVIKTAIWFDVLASVTTQAPPHFLEAIRAMFDPNRSGIYDASYTPAQYSMMSPMGCENHVVWALAETSELSAWKQKQMQKGSLSVPELVSRASIIESALSPPTPIPLPREVLQCCRHLTSEIFRASTRLYLRSVVSGDYPHVPDIKQSVDETLQCIERINEVPRDLSGQPFLNIARSVVRSTVFSFLICGAFAEKSGRSTIIHHLKREMGEAMGNCRAIYDILEKLWKARADNQKGGPVEWREMLKGSPTLLV